jgi:hypothetical protein
MRCGARESSIGFGIGLEIVGHQWTFCGSISKTGLTNSKTYAVARFSTIKLSPTVIV